MGEVSEEGGFVFVDVWMGTESEREGIGYGRILGVVFVRVRRLQVLEPFSRVCTYGLRIMRRRWCSLGLYFSLVNVFKLATCFVIEEPLIWHLSLVQFRWK